MIEGQEILVLQGLPGSGKSTWALAKVREGKGTVKRVNKDDLRAMVDDGIYSDDRERMILALRDTVIRLALDHPRVRTVIVDDTNLSPKHERHLRQVFGDRADVSVKSFTDVPISECIERDRRRANSVGSRVIHRMNSEWLAGQGGSQAVEWQPGLPEAVICDLDGTLAVMQGRSPYDYSRVGEDALCEPVLRALRSLSQRETDGLQRCVILLSGRDSSCLDETVRWLSRMGVEYDFLHMRAGGDARHDDVIKQELFDERIRGRYNVVCVLDDRNRVVDMWRRNGLLCLQVVDGDF